MLSVDQGKLFGFTRFVGTKESDVSEHPIQR